MTLLMIILLLVLVGAIPAWPYSRSWGYGPSGILLVLLVVLLVLSAWMDAVLGAVIGPPLLSALFGSAYQVEPLTVAALVLAATAIAWLYVTGPATLARHLHTPYSLGWAIAAVVAIGCLALPLPLEAKAVLALLVGPLVGVVIHVAAQVRSLRGAVDATEPIVEDQEERQ